MDRVRGRPVTQETNAYKPFAALPARASRTLLMLRYSTGWPLGPTTYRNSGR